MRYTSAPWNVNQVESFGRAFTAGLRNHSKYYKTIIKTPIC